MSDHFLADFVEGEPGFVAEPWYNPHGDCIVYQMADVAVVANRVDEVLTVYESAIDRRPIGFQIKGVAALVKKFGVDGLGFSFEAADGEVKAISVALLLLAAYEEGPHDMQRRAGYAKAIMRAEGEIAADELQPA